MQKNKKSGEDGRENKRNRSYYVTNKGHGEFTQHCRRVVRRRAAQALREGEEPLPKDPKSKEWYD